MPVTRKRTSGEINARVTIGALKGMEAWGMLVAQRAAMQAPVGKPQKRHPDFHGQEWRDQSTRLATSIHVDPEGPRVERVDGRKKFTIRIGTNVPYARAQEMGSGIHSESPHPQRRYPIVAGKLQDPELAGGRWALFFFWPDGPQDSPAHYGDGWFHFAYVMHPGVPAQPYLRPALQESLDEGKQLFYDAIKAELARP